MSHAFDTVQQFAKMLRNLDQWIDKAVAHAKAKSFDPDVLVSARLAPDQYPFQRQVQSACDAAKFAAVYLTGKTAPANPDTETTIPQLKERLATVIGILETFKEEDYAGADERRVAPPWMHGKWLRGDHYLAQLAVPNFYFHVAMAYAILRHNGVDLGKMIYIGGMPMRD